MEEIEKKTVGYQEFKQALDQELQKAAEGFVKIGFMLRLALETEILVESGYKDVYEFAEKEYSLDKSQVSRVININIKFSEDGHSDRLKEQYRGYGYAKLAVMLQLPEQILEELSPEFSKTEIQAIHEEIKEEKKISDIEVWLEPSEQAAVEMETTLEKTLHQLCRMNVDLYKSLHGIVKKAPEGQQEREIQGVMAPAGEMVYFARIPGTGKMMLSAKGPDQPVAVINVRDNEKELFAWRDVAEAVRKLCAMEDWKKNREVLYGEPVQEPEKAEVAPVQPTEKKKARKVSKVITEPKKKESAPKAPEKEAVQMSRPAAAGKTEETEEPGEKTAESEQKTVEPERKEEKTDPEEGTPVQTTVEDFPELLPEGYEPAEKKEPSAEEKIWEEAEKKLEILNQEMGRPVAERDPEYMILAIDLLREYLEEVRTARAAGDKTS